MTWLLALARPPRRRCSASTPATTRTSRLAMITTSSTVCSTSPIPLTHELADVRANIVVRIRDDRVFYTDPTPTTGAIGRPRRHGHRRGCADPDTWPTPTSSRPPPTPGTGHRQRLSLARPAPQTRPPRTPGGPRPAADRGRHRDPGRRAAPAQTHQRDQEDDVAVGRRTRLRPRHLLAGLPAPLPHRTHLGFLKNTLGWTAPALRTPEQADRWTWLVLAACTQLPPRQRSRAVPPHALGTTTQTRPTHPRTGPKGISPTCPDTGHASQSTKIANTRPRTRQGHPTRATNPLPRDQEGRIAGFSRNLERPDMPPPRTSGSACGDNPAPSRCSAARRGGISSVWNLPRR